jgi:uncharacterized YigZ family protein
MENDEYRTLKGTSEGIYKEKGSKFIALAMPVANVGEVKTELEKIRKKYYDARHHCYAYQVGFKQLEFRYNDDGEPSGTAGKPIYGQIQSHELNNVLIVVIRYFGGIKLGTGGLIQAYRSASKDAIENGQVIIKTWTVKLKISFDYRQMNEVMRIIKEGNLHIISQVSAEKCCIILEIRHKNFDNDLMKFLALETLESMVI